MRAVTLARHLAAPAGLLVGPALWAVNMQWGQIAPYLDCRTGLHLNAATSFTAATLTLAAGWLSWRSVKRREAGADTVYPHTFSFVGWLGALAAPIFAYALLLQALSGVMLTGCER